MIQREVTPLAAFDLPDKAARALVIGDGNLVAVAGDPMICIAGEREIWRAAPGRVGEPVIAGDRVVTAEARGERLTARDLASGEMIWTLPGPGWLFQAALPQADGALAALRMTDRDGVSLVLLAREGTPIKSLRLGGAVTGMAMRGQELVVATRTQLMGIGPAGDVRWRASPGGFGAASAGDVTTAPLVRATGTIVLGWSTPSGSVLHEVDPIAQTVHPITRHLAALGHLALTGVSAQEVLATAHERVLVRLDANHTVEVAHELTAPATFLVGSPNGTLLVGESHSPSYWESYHHAYNLRAHVSQFHLDGGIERWQAPGAITAAGVDGTGRIVIISAGVLHTLGNTAVTV